jgi:Icc-related predicted phosphoesterase
MTRLFHTTDLHASELVWKKTLNSAEYYKADVILLLGDLTGKAIVPFVKVSDSEWYCNPYGKREIFSSREQVEERKNMFRNKGWYVFETTPTEVEEFKASPMKREELFTILMKHTLDKMLGQLDEVNFQQNTKKFVVCPGNDDIFEIDDVIKKHERVIFPLEKVVEIDSKREMVSCEYVNPTPWKTPRECSEEQLEKKLEKEIKRSNQTKNLICNFHAPPYGSGLDRAPKLDKDLKPITDFGNPIFENVGSKAVLNVIKKHQPLLGLHGHIHESAAHAKIGRTICMNPGSEYQIGTISGYVIDLPEDRTDEVNYWRVTG